MDLHLNGKAAVVTGAGKGIGLAITQGLVAEGALGAAGARHITTELAELAVDGRVHPVTVDLATPDCPAELLQAAASALGGLDILINNVGAVRPRTGGFLSITDDDWISALTINFLAAVRTTRAALPFLLHRGTGTIVTVASVNSWLPDPLVIDYSAAKAADHADSQDGWRVRLRQRFLAARQVMLGHPWAPGLLHSRTTVPAGITPNTTG